MWRQSNGFTLFEVLAALVVWMMTITLLLPSLVLINQERKSLELEREARFLLTREYEKIRVDEEPFSEKVIERKGHIYKLIRKSDNSVPAMCITHIDFRDRNQTRCVYWHD